MKKYILNNVILSICIIGVMTSLLQLFLGNFIQFFIYNIFFCLIIFCFYQEQLQKRKELKREINQCYYELKQLIELRDAIPHIEEYISFLRVVNLNIYHFNKKITLYHKKVSNPIRLKNIFKTEKEYYKLNRLVPKLKNDIHSNIIEMMNLKLNIDTTNMNYQTYTYEDDNSNKITNALNILGLSAKQLSLDNLKRAYRHLVKLYHPDNGGNPEIFNQINIAYELVFNQLK